MKIKKVLAGTLGFALIIGLLLLANSLVGNPISKLAAQKAIKEYTASHYSHLDLELGKVNYNFKFGCYGAMAQSKTSEDTKFYIYTDSLGKNVADYYESEVANCFTTWRRLSSKLDEEAEKVIKPLGYDFDHISIEFYEDEKGEDVRNKLSLDMTLDIQNPPAPLEADVCLFTEDVSWEKIVEVAMRLDEAMKANSIPIETISVRLIPLENKRAEGEAVSWMNSLDLTSFPVARMSTENLAEVMAQYEEDYENGLNAKDKEVPIE